MVAGTHSTYRFLIVDDDENFRGVLMELFKPYVDLVEAECGEQALEMLKHVEVHLCILDMHMRALTGLDTIRSMPRRTPRPPCILITANVNDRLRREAGDAEVYSVLSKPFQRMELLNTCASAIEDVYSDRKIHDRFKQGC